MQRQVIRCCNLVKNDCIVFHIDKEMLHIVLWSFFLWTITDFYSAALSKKKNYCTTTHCFVPASQCRTSLKSHHLKSTENILAMPTMSHHALDQTDWGITILYPTLLVLLFVMSVQDMLVIIILEAVESLDITQYSYPFSARS